MSLSLIVYYVILKNLTALICVLNALTLSDRIPEIHIVVTFPNLDLCSGLQWMGGNHLFKFWRCTGVHVSCPEEILLGSVRICWVLGDVLVSDGLSLFSLPPLGLSIFKIFSPLPATTKGRSWCLLWLLFRKFRFLKLQESAEGGSVSELQRLVYLLDVRMLADGSRRLLGCSGSLRPVCSISVQLRRGKAQGVSYQGEAA
jgi:hypothetical protein